MPISLSQLENKLKQRLRVLDSSFTRHLIAPLVSNRVDTFAIQEGYVSSLWQTWCAFCRQLAISSVQGSITKAQATTTSPYSAYSEMEVAYVAKKLAKNQPIGNIRALTGSHDEPTWGDLNKINSIFTGLGTSNSAILLTGFSACLRLQDLQLCRNASAHISRSTLHDVRAARVRYVQTDLRHPSDMMFWVDPQTNDFLWKSWIMEMELAADFATQ